MVAMTPTKSRGPLKSKSSKMKYYYQQIMKARDKYKSGKQEKEAAVKEAINSKKGQQAKGATREEAKSS